MVLVAYTELCPAHAIDGTTSFSEGCLYVPNFSPILQTIHFEGEIGNWTLYHGYPEMPWVFDGIISAPSLALFNTQIGAIQTAIDGGAPTGANGTYQTLVDSFGNFYDQAQVRQLTFTSPPHIWYWNNSGTLTAGYLCAVRVTGIVNGKTHIGATT
jgi:hypothetical protein